MSLAWLIILVIYGLVTGWDILPLMWWLLVPLAGQDLYDANKKK